MDTRTREALVTLFGDEAKADEFISKVDETNRAIADGGLLTRETTTEQTEATTTEQVTETPPETAIIPGEQDASSNHGFGLTLDTPIIKKLAEVTFKSTQEAWAKEYGSMIDQFNAEMHKVVDAVNTQETQLAELKQARETDVMTFTTQATTLGQLKDQLVAMVASIDALKLTDEEKQRTWLADRPPSAAQPVTYRPREDRRSNPEGTKPSFADIAAGTLARMPK